MIRKVLLSTVALAAISGTAFAADLPSRRAPPVYIPPPIPIFSWTGFYVGGDVGYAFGKDLATQYPAGGTPVAFNVGRRSAIIGGAHVGYNFSTQSLPLLSGLGSIGGGGLVVGVEGDITGSDYQGTQNFPGARTLSERDSSDVQGSIRGRVGVAVDRALFFATGGAAFAQFHDNYAAAGAAAAGAPAIGTLSTSHQRIGYTVGGGIEYAITTAFSLRAEYRYSDYGHYTDTTFGTIGAFNEAHRITMQRATIGFSYKFETPQAQPVVARY